MIHKNLLNYLPHKTAYAHCDIPCGVYDPNMAQMSTHTIIRMTQLLNEVKRSASADGSGETKAEHDISRITRIKEKHCDILEHELITLERDYFKPEYYEKFPDLKELFTSSFSLTAKCRQGIDLKTTEDLLNKILVIAEIFYKSKSLESLRVKAPYPTGLDIVVQR
jgi:nickel superoxide dismutase